MKIRLFFILSSLSISGHAQFLLANPDFDNNLSTWSIDSTPAAVWNSFDINNSATSGSALLTNAESTVNTDVEALSQCLAFPNPGMHTWALTAYIPSGQATTGSVVMRFNRYLSNDCSTGLLGSAGYYVAQSNTPDEWTGDIQQNNIGSFIGSMKFIIAIRKTEAGGQFIAYADAAILENTDYIFAAGFE